MNRRNGFIEFLKKFAHHRLALAAAIILLIEIALIGFLPVVMNLDPYTSDVLAFKAPPSAAHWFGTDDTGRDLFARVICGGKTSLMVGLLSVAISVGIGLPLGLIAGYFRGAAEMIIMRLAEVFMSFPTIILVLVVVSITNSKVITLIFIIGIMGWPAIAKLIYGSVLSVREKEFIKAARATGELNISIILRYILPNATSPLWVSLPFRISQAIILESSLSFLGAGIQPPEPSWGNIIYAAQNLTVLKGRPWLWSIPGAFLIVTIICINFVGEGVRDAFDPKIRR